MTILAWHFVVAGGSLRVPVGTETHARPGVTLRHEGPLVLCESGLHASVSPLDAIEYAPGPVVCRVRMGGDVLEVSDKLVARERTVLWMADASRALRGFACDCAERALLRERGAGREPDARSREAVRVAREFAAGRASREQLYAARAAAHAAAAAAAAAAHAASRAASAANAASAAAYDDADSAAHAAYAAHAARSLGDRECSWQARALTRRLLKLNPGGGHGAKT